LEELPQIENKLTTIATSIKDYWQPFKTWAPITLLLSQNGVQLAATTNMLFVATLVLYGFETGKQRKLNKIVREKLSDANKQMIDIIRETERTGLPTLGNIANKYSEMMGQPIDQDQLLEKLLELENAGAIDSHITSKQDEPYQTWKT
jgi:hypothetical protein